MSSKTDTREGQKAQALCFKSAVELVSLMRRAELSAVEVLTAHLEQIERVNPRVNALCTLVPEYALQQARNADRQRARGARARAAQSELRLQRRDPADRGALARGSREAGAPHVRGSGTDPGTSAPAMMVLSMFPTCPPFCIYRFAAGTARARCRL